MIEYIIETIICSGILYLSFLLLFRRSRNYQANRFLLLLSVLFALLVPLANISVSSPLVQEMGQIENLGATLSNLPDLSLTQVELGVGGEEKTDVGLIALLLVYGLPTIVLLLRFCLNLYALLSGKYVRKRIWYKGKKIALVSKAISPFSFLKTIYLHQESFEQKGIEEELFLHESGHVRQLHSVDILFMELIQIFFWFNPFIFLFKKLIKTNHEYLADEFVIRSGMNKIKYSHMLINYTIRDKSLKLSSGFSYPLIKNRLIMLKKYDQKGRIIRRLSLFLPILLALFTFTAFSNPDNGNLGAEEGINPGYFFADSVFWSGENQKVYLKGEVKIRHGENNITGRGTFSFLETVHLLIINGKEAVLDDTLEVTGIKCQIITLSKKEAQKKYGKKGQFGAVEINIPK